MKHATIIPLIGGEAIASSQVFGTRPDYILSFSDFEANEKHLLNYWNNEVPYYILDRGDKHPHYVDVVSTLCPCAGLSLLSQDYGDHNANNRWMIESANYVLGEMKPKVFWGENAPGLAGKVGQNIRKQLVDIGVKNGYTMTIYRTKSLLHGVPQVRERTFYFFWKDERTPLLNYYFRPYDKIEDVISGAKGTTQTNSINTKKPSEDPYYRYLREVVLGGVTHREYFDLLDTVDTATRWLDCKSMIEQYGHTYKQMADWMRENNFPKEVDKCERFGDKLANGLSIMRRGTIVPKDHIGAFVGHYPMVLTHPYEDRFISYREALTIMGMPDDFELLRPKQSINHICQNVPVKTASDMAVEVKKYLEGNLDYVNAKLVFQHNHTMSHEILDDEEVNTLESFFV